MSELSNALTHPWRDIYSFFGGKGTKKVPVPSSKYDIPLEEMGCLSFTSGNYLLQILKMYIDTPDIPSEKVYGKVEHGLVYNYRLLKQFDTELRGDLRLTYVTEGINCTQTSIRFGHINPHFANEGGSGKYCWDFGFGQGYYYFVKNLPTNFLVETELSFFERDALFKKTGLRPKGKIEYLKLTKEVCETLTPIAKKYLTQNPTLSSLKRETYTRE
ncbi:hypothetical protein HY636_01540 [Candidatus Woesearchaeota archaeon]|nr:hypothetical protein [Candidatus Woesearchaeota archaeon]